MNPLCSECEKEGIVREWEELDHHIPIAHGGKDTDDNRVGLCREHHKIKTAKEFGLTYKPKVVIGIDGFPVK
jgi:5-methylcytosine-specific restriction endonuclease McrA